MNTGNDSYKGINGKQSPGETVAVVIAAGLSARMGEFKPLLDIGGRAALFRLIDSIKAAKVERIVVVTGHRHDAVKAAVHEYGYDSQVETVHNEDYKDGMFTSVKAGIGYVSKMAATRALLFPVDVPLVRTETIRGLFDAYGARAECADGSSPRPFAVPVYKGKNGHPLLIPSDYFGEILAYDGDGGLKAVRSRYDETLMKFETNDEGCTLDMDTPQDYIKMVEFFKSVGGNADAPQGHDKPLEENDRSGGNGARRGPRVFLVRHGQPEQHSGKIFLGQVDVPLSALGKQEAAEAAERLIALGARPARLYASDLTRARQTAEIISSHLSPNPPIEPDKLFREMSMGSWDGELIEDIKAKFPEEYAKRGEDLRNYRTPGGENFYELRGRVTREFYRILTEETGPEEDIVIVAHLGVVVVLTEELCFAEAGAGNSTTFPTGSVTEVELFL